MPTKRTKVIAARVPEPVAEALAEEAATRGITVNEILNLDLAAKYKRGDGVRKTSKQAQNANAPLPPLPEEEAS